MLFTIFSHFFHFPWTISLCKGPNGKDRRLWDWSCWQKPVTTQRCSVCTPGLRQQPPPQPLPRHRTLLGAILPDRISTPYLPVSDNYTLIISFTYNSHEKFFYIKSRFTRWSFFPFSPQDLNSDVLAINSYISQLAVVDRISPSALIGLMWQRTGTYSQGKLPLQQ